MIRVRIQAKRFGELTVLRDLSFSLEAGETLSVTGPSGIGKTTLLRIVAGLDNDFEGKVERPARLAMVFQEPTLLPWRTSLENISCILRIDADAALRALTAVGLQDKAGLYPSQLSLGQKRRLSLARAFASDPELLLMDEPFVSLDPAAADDMMRLTEKLLAKKPMATIFVTHSTAEAARFATHTLALER